MKEAIQNIEEYGVIAYDFVDSNTKFEYDIEELVEEAEIPTIKENESICSRCDKITNDEMKFDDSGDPYCEECFEEIQDKLCDIPTFRQEDTLLELLEEAREKHLERKRNEG